MSPGSRAGAVIVGGGGPEAVGGAVTLGREGMAPGCGGGGPWELRLVVGVVWTGA